MQVNLSANNKINSEGSKCSAKNSSPRDSTILRITQVGHNIHHQMTLSKKICCHGQVVTQFYLKFQVFKTSFKSNLTLSPPDTCAHFKGHSTTASQPSYPVTQLPTNTAITYPCPAPSNNFSHNPTYPASRE